LSNRPLVASFSRPSGRSHHPLETAESRSSAALTGARLARPVWREVAVAAEREF
jgi:hypothetical protein